MRQWGRNDKRISKTEIYELFDGSQRINNAASDASEYLRRHHCRNMVGNPRRMGNDRNRAGFSHRRAFLPLYPAGIKHACSRPHASVPRKIKNPILQAPFAAIGASVTLAVMVAWCYLCMFLLLQDAASSSIFPLLLWTYGAVTGPFVFMAQKDQQAGGGNEYSLLALFFYQIGFIINMVIIGFFDFDIEETLPVFVGVMAVAMLVQVIVMIAQTKAQARYSSML